LLGVETFLIWLGTNHFRMWLDIDPHIDIQHLWLMSPWPILYTFIAASLQMLGSGLCLIPFLAYLATRLLPRPWLAGLVAAGLAAASAVAITLGSVQPAHWKVALL
jgi:hypothetical protein